jgi:two-component system NtrC family response regulator
MDRRILVVDDDEPCCERLSRQLARPGRRVKIAHDGTAALDWLVEGQFSLVLVDLHLPGIDGLDVIREVRRRGLSVTTILMTGDGSVESAVEAMRLGAYDYLVKPIEPAVLDLVVDHALDDRLLRDELAALRRGLGFRSRFHGLVGHSPRMREVFTTVSRVAPSSFNVLITGETGTGKDLVARALHDGNPARRGPLVTVNCGAVPEPLLASELFGHERGAFTDASSTRQGRFEQADGGTLFLDEIAEMSLSMQAKILRVLQDGTFDRVGGTTSRRADVRILAATNADLRAAVAAGRFREDLFYRLNVVTIDLPPLRDRLPEDLPLLVELFTERLAGRGGPRLQIDRQALARMARYDWPGNVRELENLVERLAATCPGPVVRADDLPATLVPRRDAPLTLDFDLDAPIQGIVDDLTGRIERAYLVQILELTGGRVEPAAARSGLSRRSFSEKLRRHGIDKADFRRATAGSRPMPAG